MSDTPLDPAVVAGALKLESVAGDSTGADNLEDGQFSGYASVFDVVDSYGDGVAPGAFARSLAEWESSGDFIPLLWGHNMDDPDFNVGHIVSAVEDDHGLRVVGQVDADSPKGEQVRRLLRSRRVREMSFAFTVAAAEDAVVDGELARKITDLDLVEVSIVPVAANQKARVDAVKSRLTPPTSSKETPVTTTHPTARLHADWAQLLEKKSALEGLVSKGELGAADALDKLVKGQAYREAAAKITAAAGSGSLAADAPSGDAIGFKAAGARGGVERKNALVSGPAALRAKARDLAGKIEAKAVGVDGISSSGEIRDDVLVTTDILTDGRPAGGLLEVLGSEKADPVFSYLRQTLRENNARAVAVGEVKPTSRYAVERVQAKLKPYAHISDPVDSYILADAGALSGWLQDEMSYGIGDAIEAQAVADLLTQAGVEQAFRGDLLATTRAALTQLQNAGLAPAVFALSPADWETIELSTASGSDEYRFHSAPVNAAEHTLWSVPVAVVPTMPTGQGSLVAADSVSIFTDEQLRIDWDGAGALFDRNQVRLRLETRALPAVRRPAGVVHLATAPAAV